MTRGCSRSASCASTGSPHGPVSGSLSTSAATDDRIMSSPRRGWAAGGSGFDPKLPGPREKVAHPHDISTAVDSPFLTAAGAWIGYRQHGRSIDDLGIRIPTAEFMGPPFVLTYLIMDVAHRFGDELLLWDYWGAIPLPGRTMHVELGDELADLVVHADAGDVDAERQLEHIHAPIRA